MLVSGRPTVRGRKNHASRVVVPVTAVLALGLGAGVLVASSGGSPARVHQAAASSSQGVTSTGAYECIVPWRVCTTWFGKTLYCPFGRLCSWKPIEV